jgi:hypothetical protein
LSKTDQRKLRNARLNAREEWLAKHEAGSGHVMPDWMRARPALPQQPLPKKAKFAKESSRSSSKKCMDQRASDLDQLATGNSLGGPQGHN